MILECNFTAPIARTMQHDYVREITIDIRCFDEAGANDYLVGRIALSQVLWNDARAESQSLFEICDNDSQGLYEVFTELCDESGEVRPEFEIDDVFNHVIFVYRVVLHPEVRPYAQSILDAAVDLLGHDALVVMWRGLGGIADTDLAELGFRKVAGIELICRQSTHRSKFSDKHPRGQDVDLAGRPEFESWFNEEWKRSED